jgi:hypothetical protein
MTDLKHTDSVWFSKVTQVNSLYILYPLGGGGGLWWKFEIKTQDWTLSKNNNPGWVFIKKYQEPCFHDFFLKLIIWNIDIHTCLLDSTFLCPHLYINNNFRRRSIFSIFIGISSVAEYHINCLCTELSSLLCIQSSCWYIKGMIHGHQGKMLNMLYTYILIYWSIFLL